MDAVDVLIASARVAGDVAPSPRPAVASGWTLALAIVRAAWPQLVFDEGVLARFIGERLAGDELAQALAGAPVADLALAAACAAQDPLAHAAFDGMLAEVELAGARTRADRDLVDEVKQILRLQLLVIRDGKPPAIVGYRGRGPLRAWVRITATRELVRHQKKLAREQPIERALDELIDEAADPTLARLKVGYRTEFATALREAIADLGPEDRTLLRQQIVDHLSIDQIGIALGIHRATAARWINRARDALVAATHRRLAERLAITVDEIDSVIRLVESQLEASVVRYLRDG